jgi:hypothetical protein
MFKCLREAVSNPNRHRGSSSSPHFRVSHQSFLQADGQPVSSQLCRVVGIPDAVHVGGFTVEDGITVVDIGETPAIVYAGERRISTAGRDAYVGPTSSRPCLQIKVRHKHFDRLVRHPNSRFTLPSAAPVRAFLASLVSSNTGLSRCSVDIVSESIGL